MHYPPKASRTQAILVEWHIIRYGASRSPIVSTLSTLSTPISSTSTPELMTRSGRSWSGYRHSNLISGTTACEPTEFMAWEIGFWKPTSFRNGVARAGVMATFHRWGSGGGEDPFEVRASLLGSGYIRCH